ncbi:DMT family transporter [Phaeobacter sp. C3_T13_0]|uniref:DMT family transporter n=1 Tax=Phaeobacter cretensis TaxID=3342641 RepID=UPI0039BD5DDD
MNASDNTALTTGIITILLTVFAMALTDAFVKYASSNMTLWQIYVCRSLLALPFLVLLARGRIWPQALGWVTLRSIMLMAMYLAIYAAIPVLDLSVIAATLYTGPLFIVLLSAIVLKEPIRLSHWGAVALGFVGVLCVVQPGGAAFTILSLIPVVAAFLYACAAVLTRAKCTRETPVALAINLNLALIFCGALVSVGLFIASPSGAANYPFLLGTWSGFDWHTVSVLAVMAVLIVGVTLGLARAYQSPRPQIIATFDYAYLIFAAFWGYAFFGEVPDIGTVVGIVLIILAGILVLRADVELKSGAAPT